MEIATRFHPRARTGSYRDVEGGMMPEDSGGESESNMVRRKFQRTTTDPDMTSDNTFRKPSIPASATRHAAGLERRPSLSQRRKSTLRENVRVPSGPRDFPGSPGKQRQASTSSIAPAVTETTNRSFLPHSNSGPAFYSNRMASSSNTRVSTDDVIGSPARGGRSFDFLPDVNFDDFQTSIKNYDGTSPLLSEFPTHDGGRALPKDSGEYSMARGNGFAATARQKTEQQPKGSDMGRTQSLRQRLAGGRQNAAAQPTNARETAAAPPRPSNEALGNRRQSSVPQSSMTSGPPPPGPAAKPPRKSVGPGLLTSMMKGNNGQQMPTSEPNTKPALARTSSLSKARRTTIQPSTSAGPEIPRLSTLTATTQSRQNKVKSLQPPPRDQQDPNTPSNGKPASKANQNRAHTPSSSGNRRQSLASGRASGLGARTVSPTDARRQQRRSMMQPPPMPTFPKAHTPTPQDEIPNPLNSADPMPELPRLTQPSPSFIPRMTSSATPTSARESPEGRHGSFGGGISLSSKSSYQSLMSNSMANGSTSRLPTPKPRITNSQSSSSMANYSDSYEERDNGEFVPPVPAIPKAFESPRDLDPPPFFSSSIKSTNSGFSDSSMGQQYAETAPMPSPWASLVPRTSLDAPAETHRKRSGEHARPVHKHTNTLTDGTTTVPPSTAPPRSVRAQPDPNGRKNANLQPLRLPPLNLVPFNTRQQQHAGPASQPRPSEEIDARDDFMSVQTPEPKRSTKTPSTPMTASKATFFKRQEDKALRQSSSHYALRDLTGMDAAGNMLTKFWDDSDGETAAGVPIPYGNGGKPRNAITPFSSGSLPKRSGEFARLRGRPSGEYGEDEYSLGTYENLHLQNSKPQGPRVRAQTGNPIGTAKSMETPMQAEEQPLQKVEGEKKESAGGGLRRKLSLGWRRSSSKAANHADNKNSPPHESTDRPERSRLQKRNVNAEMPPPKLPASATWSGDVPALPPNARPSLEQRRRSQIPASTSSVNLGIETEQFTATVGVPSAGVKTRSLHSEQPMPVTSSTASRVSSWGNMHKLASNHRHKATSSSSISVLTKDKDDLIADDEMHRLSRKRKDVDSAARETEQLKKRAVARSPVNAEHVLHDRGLIGGSVLNVFERGEIVDYEKDGIYFTGTVNARKIIGSLTPSPTHAAAEKNSGNNYGYDDERGDYNIVLGDHLAYRYEVIDVLGKGSFGQVVRCVDHKDGGVVAVKIIRNKKRFHQQALVEVGILGRLREWDPDGGHATLSITTSFYFRSHLCIVTPCLSINLYELIRAHNFVGFALPLIRRFARQLLACLILLQTKRIIHCDLKPENILVCEARKADVRVIDFGSSCREEEKVYTYIQSRFYRSPEVILGSSYGLGIDMWSLGCILAELWTGYPIFPGENEQEQLACIMEIFGPPDRHLVERCTRKKLFFDSVGKPRVTVSSKGRRRRPSSKTLQQALKSEDEAFLDFITRCLRWDPDRRLKPSEAITHPFITNLPLSQRSGIPDEARRAARVRSSAAVPPVAATNGVGVPSPVKRTTVASSGNAFAQQQQHQQVSQQMSTPQRDRTRPLPETPQTAVRNGGPLHSNSSSTQLNQGSPVRPTFPSMTKDNRRHSTFASASAAAVAGSKRASNGAVLGMGTSAAVPAQTTAGRGASNGSNVSIAQMAASAATAGNGGPQSAGMAARWRA